MLDSAGKIGIVVASGKEELGEVVGLLIHRMHRIHLFF